MNRWEILDTYYWWLSDHHSGQWSRDYARLSRVSRVYRPSPLARGAADPDAYRTLCERAGCKHPPENRRQRIQDNVRL